MSPTSERPVRLAVLGAGGRGREVYAGWARRHPDRARIVAVADTLTHRRDGLGDEHEVPADARFDDWKQLLADADRLDLDAVIVALPDAVHVDPALEAARRGLAVLLEKPAAPTAAEVERLRDGAAATKAEVAVSHVLRCTPFWRTVRSLVDSGVLGELVTIRHEENIGFWHFAHSYVRGNWRRADESSPMVLAKTCHDLDLIRWFAGAAPSSVSSVGSLRHFRAAHAPEGAPARCLDGCPHADSCAFYAPRYYVDALADTQGFPVSLLSHDTSREGRLEALRTGPYGRCVYHCDNDVVDHQQTVVEFDNGVTATLSTSAFTGANTRTVQMTFTAGELVGRMDTGELDVHLFSPTAELAELPAEAEVVSRGETGPMRHRVVRLRAVAARLDNGDHAGHAGGDDVFLDRFVTALQRGTLGEDRDTSLAVALDSHLMAFAAERSRLSGQTVRFPQPPS